MRTVALCSGLVLLFAGIVLWVLGLWVGDSRMSGLAVGSRNLLSQHDWPVLFLSLVPRPYQ